MIAIAMKSAKMGYWVVVGVKWLVGKRSAKQKLMSFADEDVGADATRWRGSR